MASHPGNFPTSPNRKSRGKRSKRRPESDIDDSQAKKNKCSKDVYLADGNEGSRTDEATYRPKRSGAGSGGRVSQLEKIGMALEKPTARPQRVTGIAEDLPDNPLAPPKKQKRRKAKSSNPPPPYPTVPPPGPFHERNDQSSPHFYSAHNGDRFGFSTMPLAPIVPPGTEPDLQAINNPYVAAARSQAATIPASSASTVPSQLPRHSPALGRLPESRSLPVPSKPFVPQSIPIDPVLLHAAPQPPRFPSKTHPRLMAQDESSSSESGEERDGSSSEEKDSSSSSEDDEDDMPEVGWAASGQVRATHPGFAPEIVPVPSIRHHSLPPDHEFQYSRDEDEQAAGDTLRTDELSAPLEVAGQGTPEDVLERHHKNNGCRSAPTPEQLASLAQPSQTETVPRARALRNSKKAKDATPSADSLGFYHPTWKDCLEDAKRECRAAHALNNPFPSRARDLDSSITESLITAVVEWTKRGTAFQPGYWPEHKRDMAAVLLGDMSTWRSELKKIAIAHAPVAFNLIPPATVVQERPAWVENAVSKLLEQSMFLRNGIDQNGKTNNFTHPSLKHALIEFFYTGSYRIADKRPNLFRASIPLPCIALVGAAYNCVLDGFSKNGGGRSFPNFSGKAYNSVFRAMLGMLNDIEEDLYHGPKLQAQLVEWAKDGWNALQNIDSTVGRHNHLQIALD